MNTEKRMKTTKVFLNPKLGWPFDPPKKPKRVNKKKELERLLASISEAPF